MNHPLARQLLLPALLTFACGGASTPPPEDPSSIEPARAQADESGADDVSSTTTAGSPPRQLPPPSEDVLNLCSEDADCVVVDYRHCCGAERRAINRAYLEAYRAHPEWQSFFDEEACAVIGQCPSYEGATEARCAPSEPAGSAPGRCQIVR